MRASQVNQSNNVENSPSVWFMRLERAKNLNDFEGAATAVRELRRLGVTVKFDRRKEVGPCTA